MDGIQGYKKYIFETKLHFFFARQFCKLASPTFYYASE